MAPAQTMRWRETGLGPRTANVEVEGTEPYIVGGHTASGYWVDTARQTTVPGLFAAGDVAGGCPQKYVTGAFAAGAYAAEGAARYAAAQEVLPVPTEAAAAVRANWMAAVSSSVPLPTAPKSLTLNHSCSLLSTVRSTAPVPAAV